MIIYLFLLFWHVGNLDTQLDHMLLYFLTYISFCRFFISHSLEPILMFLLSLSAMAYWFRYFRDPELYIYPRHSHCAMAGNMLSLPSLAVQSVMETNSCLSMIYSPIHIRIELHLVLEKKERKILHLTSRENICNYGK